MKKILEQTLACDLTLELADYAVTNKKKLLSIHAVSEYVQNAKMDEETLGEHIDLIAGIGFNAEEAYNEIANRAVTV